MLCFCGAMAIVRSVNSEAPHSMKAKEPTQMFNVGQGAHTASFQIGRDTHTSYLGAASLQQALQVGQARPVSMVADDFNGDGMSDLVVGYANKSGGVLSVRQGNLEAIAPQDPAVLQGLSEGRYPAPFSQKATLMALPEAPDFLQVGDFDADGFMDVLSAARGGSNLYLVPSDGHGAFKAIQKIELLGQITSMQSDDFKQAGRLTAVALGVMAPDGPQIALYNEGNKGLQGGSPDTFAMPAEVGALAFGRLDDDNVADLAAAVGSEVFVVHGRDSLATKKSRQSSKTSSSSFNAESSVSSTRIERANFPFVIKGLATGDFIFDRGHQIELALLADDGTIYLSARGDADTRAYTDQEKELVRQQRIAIRKGQQDEASLTALLDKMIERSGKSADWAIADVINTGIQPSYNSAAQGLLKSARLSGLTTDDLLVGDAGGNSVKIVRNVKDAQKLGMKGSDTMTAISDFSAEGAPLAVLPMRTSVGVEPGLVVLQAGLTEPKFGITVAATYTVDRTDDNASAGAMVCSGAANDCSLRGAIIKANGNVGADTILLAAGTTYTLTLGPFDDEFNFGGAVPESGDLDILDAVSITGGNRDTTIIQMGTLVPAQGGITKDRVLETNDFINQQHAYNVTLSNLTIQNGNAPRTPAPDNYNTKGGGIMYDGFESNNNTPSGVLTLTNCKVTTNTAAGQGGGITTIDATLIIQSTSIVSANTSTFGAGGGISYNGGNTVATQTLQINNSTIGGPLAADGNQAIDTTFGSGGGVQCNGGSGATINNGAVVQNNIGGATSGSLGGAGMIFSSIDNVAISNATISNNKSKHNGGGLFCNVTKPAPNSNNPGSLTLTTVTIQNNQADSDASGVGDGGGIYNLFGNLTLNNTSGGSLSGNSAVNGGGIFTTWIGNSLNASAGLTIPTGTTISNNTAKNNGGGIAISPGAASTFGTISITGATISNNTANSDSTGGGDGGGIYIDSGTLNPLSGVTIDSNVANSGTGDGIRQAGGTITATGTLNLNGNDSLSLSGGTFNATSGTTNITGNFINSGATFNNGGGTFNFNGSTAQTIGGTTASTFNNLIINNGSGVSLGNNETVNAALTLTNGALGVGSNTLTLNGAVSASGGSLTSNANGTVNYNQSSAGQNVLAANYGNLTFSNFAKTLPNGGTVQIRGVFTTGAGGGHTITGSTVEFNGTSAQTLPSGFTTYNNLTLNNPAGVTGFAGLTVQGLLRVQQGTFTSSSTYNNVQVDSGATLAGVNATTINVSGTWTNNGTFTANGNTVNFNGAAAQTIGGTSNNNFNNLTINNATGVTLGSNQTVNGALTLTNGVLNVAANTLTLNSTVNFTSGSISSATGGTVNYNQSSNGQNVAPSTYDNLTFSNFNKTLPASTINISGTFTPGTATGHTITGNTINFNGAGAQTIPAFTYNNLTSSGAGARTLASTGIIKIAGTFTPGSNAYTNTGSTIEFNGSAAQTIPAFNYFNLSSSGAGARTLASTGTIGIAGTFTPGTNTYTITGSTIEYNGTAAQTMPSAFATYNNLTINNAAGVTMAGNTTVNGALTFTNGTLTTNANTLTVAGTGTAGTQVAGYVIGNLLKTFSGATTFRYDVGTASGYAPVTAQVTAGSGNLTVAAKQPKQPNITGTEALQRYWTLTGTGMTANLTFQYNAADVVGNESLYQVLKFSGSTFTAPSPQSVDTVNHRGTVTGVSSFSDWTLAQPSAAFGSFNFNNPATYSVNENAGTATITVNRTSGTSGAVSVDFATVAGGTATGGAACTSGVDYINTNGTLNFASGDTSKTFPITICNDNVREGDETVNLSVSNPSGGATLGTLTTAVLTIVDTSPIPTISINNVNTLEPDTGTGIAVFTVTLSNPSTSVVTVNYATQDGTATAPSDYTAITSTPLTFNALETVKTVSVTINADAIPEPAETFDLVLSAPVNATLPAGTKGTATILPPVVSGNMLISEFRLRGSAGVLDEFIEVYNNTASSITVATSDGSAGWVVAASDGVPRFTIPAGTVLPARSHYLGANNSAGGYSLGSYPAGNGTTATPNATYVLDIPESSGIALFKTALPANFTLANTLDAAGFAATAPPYSESGTLTAPNANGEYAFVRKFASATGLPQDTNNNAADFVFVSTTGANFGTTNSYGLGAPGPENLSSPLILDRAQIPGSLIDPAQCQGCTPNRVRDFTADVPNNSTFGTLNIRRAFTNNTGAPITRLRFRLIDITTLNSPGAGASQADLRVRSSGSASVTVTGGGSVTVQGVTLETPPAQSSGGGLNSTVSAGTVTTGTPLANGATIRLQFLLGVQKSGTFSFFLNVEALP
jgi:hypothetical protein